MTALSMWYLPYLTLPYLTLPYLTLPYLRASARACTGLFSPKEWKHYNLIYISVSISHCMFILLGDITQKGYDKKRAVLLLPYMNKGKTIPNNCNCSLLENQLLLESHHHEERTHILSGILVPGLLIYHSIILSTKKYQIGENRK